MFLQQREKESPLRDQRRAEPDGFVVLAVLILLGGGLAIFLAPRLTVAPRAGETVEVTASPQVYTINDALFYPWNAYEAQDIAQLSSWAQGEDPEWYQRYLQNVPALLGLSGMEESTELGRTGAEVGFWSDCPVTTANGQPALLDVAYGQENGALGMYWVARSTGSPPTQEQKEAAIAQVETDIQEWISGQGETVTRLQDLLMNLWKELDYAHIVYDDTARESAGAEAMHPVLEPMKYIWSEVSTLRGDGLTMEKLTQEAAFYGLQIQIVTTQRHVVLVLQRRDTTTGQLCTVGAYYDMVLGDYSGLVVNRAHAVGE